VVAWRQKTGRSGKETRRIEVTQGEDSGMLYEVKYTSDCVLLFVEMLRPPYRRSLWTLSGRLAIQKSALGKS
jgi:hypothetical protein